MRTTVTSPKSTTSPLSISKRDKGKNRIVFQFSFFKIRNPKSAIENWVELNPLPPSSLCYHSEFCSIPTPISSSGRFASLQRRWNPLLKRRNRKSPVAFQEIDDWTSPEPSPERNQIQNGNLLYPAQEAQGCDSDSQWASFHLSCSPANGSNLHPSRG